MAATPSLLVFGPQSTIPSSEYLSQLRSSLLGNARLQSLRSAIQDLPQVWQRLLAADSSLRIVPGDRSVDAICSWLLTGVFPSEDSLSATFITPLTVIIQLSQYLSFTGSSTEGLNHERAIKSVEALGGIQGFCTGLLSASAIVSARDESSLQRQVGVALRLAVCIGVYVDYDQLRNGISSGSIVVRWKPEVGKAALMDSLQAYPDAYISVVSEANCVTVTAEKVTLLSLSSQLTSQGLTVKSIALQGRFHSAAHEDAASRLIEFCASNPDLQLDSMPQTLAAVQRSHGLGEQSSESLHNIAIRKILVELSNWHLTLTAAIDQLLQQSRPTILQFGLVESVPTSIIRDTGATLFKLDHLAVLTDGALGAMKPSLSRKTSAISTSRADAGHGPDSIAIVGMACHFPGAKTVSEFWDLLTEGKSMCKQMPSERFSLNNLRRSNDKLKFWGNFVDEIDMFDHKFFKKSSREAASMDPQQRLLLQVAYQAVESAGYFGEPSRLKPIDIGCYLGICSSDYNDNIASHDPTAFSSLGSLRAFLSGRLSHFFGWTGPSITYDTACSSSAVAIDAACKAILAGECSQAIAGGASLYTSPNFYQNLAAASFLSQTGPTKPFDASGDGYCRGEGVGIVMLKRMSDAVADGDHIMGVVAASAVNQNYNTTAITVPHAQSQRELYHKVASQAGVNPKSVSFVEAHGTGTPVGDPIEFDSIRQVFGGVDRTSKVHVASVKGNIGHLEAASGAAALIKTVLMMEHSVIPMQANHTKLNPRIDPLAADNMAIPLTTQKWDTKSQIACINNYGAAGSNAAMIVTQAPASKVQSNKPISGAKYPFYISANSEASLGAYCNALLETIAKLFATKNEGRLLADLSYNLSRKQNRSLSHVLAFSVASISELRDVLLASTQKSSTLVTVVSKVKPTVLVFGGQVSTFVGLSQAVYESSALLRSNLARCDFVLRKTGFKSIFPAIFQTEPVDDVVLLHSLFFAIQYACAQSWLDSGLSVDAIVGHSFGQLTGLCVSGVLSLEDALKLVTTRASLMETAWGPERGSMISVQADATTVASLITSEPTHDLEIACYNGPNSHVLVGTSQAIDAVEYRLQSGSFPSIKCKRLAVSHGFHSRFTEPLLPGLAEVVKTLSFKAPRIPIETCSDRKGWTLFDSDLIVEHTRRPVYFGQAVQRVSDRLGACTWLEAGSNSSVTAMVRSSLQSNTSHTFQGLQLRGAASIVDATVNLWKAGHKVQYWNFHHESSANFNALTLPPYQFEKNRHWLEWSEAAPETPVAVAVQEVEQEPVFLALSEYLDSAKQDAEFVIDPRSKEWRFYVEGHAVLTEPLCPAPLYIELASQAAQLLSGTNDQIPSVEGLEIQAPLGAGDRLISLRLNKATGNLDSWKFTFSSKKLGSEKSSVHATGSVKLQSDFETVNEELSRYERLVGYKKCAELSADTTVEALQGGLVYKVFNKVVTYEDHYKGVRAAFAKGNEVTGNVHLPKCVSPAAENTLLRPIAVDNFIQVAGLHTNCLTDIKDNEVYVCTKVDRIQPGPMFSQNTDCDSWAVYSNYHNTSSKELVNDIFVFDTTTKRLVFMVLGARFTRVMITSLAKVLSRANNSAEAPPSTPKPRQVSQVAMQRQVSIASEPAGLFEQHLSKPTIPAINCALEFRKLLNRVTEIPMDELIDSAGLEELGVDSLMITEVLSEINKHFNVSIEMDEFATMTDILSVVNALNELLGGQGSDMETLYSSSGESSAGIDTSFASSISTSTTTPLTYPADKKSSFDELIKALSKMVQESLELPEPMSRDTNLAEQGMDSLLCMELASDIKRDFDIEVDMSLLDTESTFGDLADLVIAQARPISRKMSVSLETFAAESKPVAKAIGTSYDGPADSVLAQSAFEQTRFDYDIYTKETGFSEFWKKVYPGQAKLVLAYTVEAFGKLGCNLASLAAGQSLPNITYLPKHQKLVDQLHDVLRDGQLISMSANGLVRSDQSIDPTPSGTLLAQLHEKATQHTAEHQLLDISGSQLAECMVGTADPLSLLFRSKENLKILEDVYHRGPMYLAISRLLGSYFGRAFSKPASGGKFHILELGGGTGGTTKYLVDYLLSQSIDFTYTFTDISGSLVAAARKRFAGRPYMQFQVLDIEKEPAEKLRSKYHAVISTNCIHATRNLELSSKHIRQMLRPDGFVSLVEFTRNMYWFDLVFGLLEGWWLFNDGREHVLADEWFWDSSMRKAGFEHVSWTDGTSEEARTLRIITAFNAKAEDPSYSPRKQARVAENSVETILYKQAGTTPLFADVYSPPEITSAALPIALMIHGGGHVMLSRKDIRPKQTSHLHKLGFLPVSIDYRLCPEATLDNGAMTDVVDSMAFMRQILPKLSLLNPSLKINSSKLAVVGWSTGGHLAMTTAFTSLQRGLAPPDAILSFYCPTDYEDACWSAPNYPEDSTALAKEVNEGGYDILESIEAAPITAYNVPPSTGRAVGGWCAPKDPRSRLVLHMNWSGQCLPVLLNGLPAKGSQAGAADNKTLVKQPQPDNERVVAVSPYAQILRGNYSTPTYLIHGDLDDLIPWQQSVRVVDALKEKGVRAEVDVPKGKIHLFDLYRDADGSSWEAIEKGYNFIAREVFDSKP